MYRVELMQNGKKVSKIQHGGKYYLPVNHGEFVIRVYNDTSTRICAVVAVDGLSVMNAELASFNSGGYVISPYNYYDIVGWRRGNNEVAKFEIVDVGQSYSEKIGKGGNQGVIGVIIYPEIQRYTGMIKRSFVGEEKTSGGIQLPYVSCNASYDSTKTCSFDSNEVRATPQAVGTGYGAKVQNNVMQVSFERDQVNRKQIILFYDTVDNLRKKGVPIPSDTYTPNAFPGDNFCPEP